MQRADSGIAAPGENQLADCAHTDQLVIENVGRHADQRQIAAALPDHLVPRCEWDEVREPFHCNGVPIARELRDGPARLMNSLHARWGDNRQTRFNSIGNPAVNLASSGALVLRGQTSAKIDDDECDSASGNGFHDSHTLSSAIFPSTALTALAAPARKPNLLLLLADDLGYGDMSCYGNPSTRTPNLDRLAAGGVRFTDFHASGPVCSPTRAGLMTGRYQQRCGITEVITAAGSRDKGLDPATQVTFAKQLKQAGYATGIFSANGISATRTKFNPDKNGFDRFAAT